eukprot:CAMPEP_0171069938 /NCGR_PEP_ID=MMETSP0766_2-20121228/9446_1 /TAXON_ID=439317 /ORGANISM="Gambierdiscus australes, Strain CAWD 149" /LENGTH=369 /DNA_ID=CAMNT_0011526361 /DNA_START=85 /DNA_END=1194 /DNA_ORIENTATION=+
MASTHAFDLQNPGNPGSENHPTNCKPCNKFNPSRPTDSCKHGKECEFCHLQHERPKHRGQRGRHALQRRQFLETRDELPKELCNIVDLVYQVPHTALDEVKRRLQTLPPQEREEKVLTVIEEIRDIGEEAQKARPDNARLRGARIAALEGASAMTELDGRLKWLVGSIHLMVRKMSDAKEPIHKIKTTVDEILKRCNSLPEVMNRPRQPEQPSGSDQTSWRVLNKLTLDSQCSWLRSTVERLVQEALVRGSTLEAAEPILDKIVSDCDVLPRALENTRRNHVQGCKDYLGESENLWELSARIEKIVGEYTQALLAAESLNDLDDLIGTASPNESQTSSRKAIDVDQYNPSAASSAEPYQSWNRGSLEPS